MQTAVPATTGVATRLSMELTLEAALAFVDSCYSEIDEEDECSDSSGGTAAAPTEITHMTRKRVKRSSGASDSTPRQRGPPSPGFFDMIDRIDQESDTDSLLSMNDALLLLDAYDTSSSSSCSENYSPQTATASASSSAFAVTDTSSSPVSVRRPKRQGTKPARSRTSNGAATMSGKKPMANTRKSTTASSTSAKQQPSKTQVSSKGAAEVSENGDSNLQKPKKKRVRKQRQELLYLRDKVVEMQQMLDDLQRGGSGNEAPSSSSTSSTVSSPAAIPAPDSDTSSRQLQGPGQAGLTSAATHIGWASLAELQMQERERAEVENRQLKATIEDQLQLVRSLERLLSGQRDVQVRELSVPCGRCVV